MSFFPQVPDCEDEMLACALRGVERGFYIDVGFRDPIARTVTRALYETGWQGINIEPVTHWFEMLERERPRDINLQLAVSDSSGHLRLFDVGGTGLSTTSCESADRYVRAGHSVSEIEVECRTLDEICEAQAVEVVHFLKIAPEAGAAVLRGMGFERVRPWVVLMGTAGPQGQRPEQAEWDGLLRGRGYHLVRGGALGRFYVADEKAELDDAFAKATSASDEAVGAQEARRDDDTMALREEQRPLHDHIRSLHGENEHFGAMRGDQRHELVSASRRAAAASADAARLRAEIAWLNGEAVRQRGEAEQLRQEAERLRWEVDLREQELVRLRATNDAILGSTSWRVTAPLRFVKRSARTLPRLARRVAYHVLRWPARLMRPMMRVLARSERLCALCVRVAGPDSWLTARTRLFLFGAPPTVADEAMPPQIEVSGVLTRRALQMLGEIGDARARCEAADRGSPARGE